MAHIPSSHASLHTAYFSGSAELKQHLSHGLGLARPLPRQERAHRCTGASHSGWHYYYCRVVSRSLSRSSPRWWRR